MEGNDLDNMAVAFPDLFGGLEDHGASQGFEIVAIVNQRHQGKND